jgi:tetratricopeptide (TPR) repeat protein
MGAGSRGGLSARTRVLTASNVTTVATVDSIDNDLDGIRALREAGRPDEARDAAVVLLNSARLGELDAVLVRNELGLALKATGAYRSARRQYEAALRITVTAIDPEDSDIAATLLHNLAGIRFVLGDLPGAARCARRGLAMRRRLFGADDLAVLLDEGNLAPILVALGEFDAAQAMLDRLLVEFTARLGETDLEVAVTLTNLGALAGHRGDWAAARHHLARATELKELRFGVDSPDLIGTLANLAVVTENDGDRARAAAVLARARRIARRALPPTHPLREHVERL